MGDNTLESLPDANAVQLKGLLQGYLKEASSRHNEVRYWNLQLIFTMKRIMEDKEVALYNKIERVQWVFWAAIILFVMGTLLNIVEKLRESEQRAPAGSGQSAANSSADSSKRMALE